jgi:hydrogenase maturation protease/hydrogenase 3 maturation protease
VKDGFGAHVFRRLAEPGAVPPTARLFDAGTSGLTALAFFAGCRKAALVDALVGGGAVGEVRRLLPEDVGPPGPEFSVHNLGVAHLLAALPIALEGRALPEVVLVAAEVAAIRPFTDRLGPPFQATIDRAILLVRQECATEVTAESATAGAETGSKLDPPEVSSTHSSRALRTASATSLLRGEP